MVLLFLLAHAMHTGLAVDSLAVFDKHMQYALTDSDAFCTRTNLTQMQLTATRLKELSHHLDSMRMQLLITVAMNMLFTSLSADSGHARRLSSCWSNFVNCV